MQLLVRCLVSSVLVVCASFALVLRPSAAQSFTSGDLYLASRTLPAVGQAIVRIDPLTGSDTLLVDLPEADPLRGTLSWDPFRDRLLAAVTTTSGVGGLIAVDAAGNVESPAPALSTPELIASRGDGLVYLFYGANQTIRYLDASNTAHDLLDVGGTGPYALNTVAREMIYDPGTNSLVLMQENIAFTMCADSTRMCAIKVPLSPDGTQVAGAAVTAQQEVSNSPEVPVGVGHLPGGEILIVVDTNTNDAEPRLLALDPLAMSLSTFATIGPYAGAGGTNAGTFSSVRGEAVVLDTLLNFLRAFGPGTSGSGTTLGSGLSQDGSSGERARLVEIGTVASPVPSLGPGGLVALMVLLGASGAYASRQRRRRPTVQTWDERAASRHACREGRTGGSHPSRRRWIEKMR